MNRRRCSRVASGPWSGPEEAPHVLVEAADGASRWALETLLRQEGYSAASCAGPTAGSCPLVEAGDCRAASEADAIVSLLEGATEVTSALREHFPKTPVITEVSTDSQSSTASLAVPSPLTRERMLRVLESVGLDVSVREVGNTHAACS